MKDLSQRALDKINQQAIKPDSKRKFLIWNFGRWLIAAISILISSLGFSVILYMLINNDWDVYKKASSSLIAFVFMTLPYFWLICLALFIFLADYYLRHTKYGYRLPLALIVISSTGLSLLLGTIFYQAGLGAVIDNELTANVRGYNGLLHDKEIIWSQPEKGLMAGTILSIEGDKNFAISDFKGKVWKIEGKDAFIRGRADFSVGGQVKLVGKLQADGVFTAEEIRPWIGRGEQGGMGPGPGQGGMNR